MSSPLAGHVPAPHAPRQQLQVKRRRHGGGPPPGRNYGVPIVTTQCTAKAPEPTPAKPAREGCAAALGRLLGDIDALLLA